MTDSDSLVFSNGVTRHLAFQGRRIVDPRV